MELQILRDQLNALENEKDRIAQQGLDITKQDATIREVKAQIADLESQQERIQAHEVIIQEATEESENFLDDIEIAGVPVIESGIDPMVFNILNGKAQAKHLAKVEALSKSFIEQKTQYQTDIKQITQRATEAENKNEQLQEINKTLEVENYQLGIDNNDLSEKVRKGAEQLAEAMQTIEQQTKWLDDFRKKELLGERGAQRVIPSTSEQIRLQEEALKASRIRVTSMVADPEDFNKRKWTVTLALTGESKEINYLEKGNYTLVTEEEAAQYRAEVEQKKADEAAQSEAIPVNEMQVEPVSEVEAPAEEKPFQENHQVDTQDSGTDTQGEGNGALDEVVGQPESEVVTLESLKAELEALKTAHDTTVVRVGNIERHANIQAVA